MAAKKTEKVVEIDVVRIEQGVLDFYILGKTPLVFNAMSEKAKRELLYPSGRKTQAQKAQTVKHDPPNEFRNSTYRFGQHDGDQPTVLCFPTTAFKSAIASAALDTPSTVSKAQMSRLTYVQGMLAPIWGRPFLWMSVVRSADAAKTPDIRTRAIVPQWASRITVQFSRPMLNENNISVLLQTAGLIGGIGDFRQQKGAGNYGLFDIVAPDDPRWLAIVENMGKDEQQDALDTPIPMDIETERLLQFWQEEYGRRGRGAKGVQAEKLAAE